MSSPNRDFFGIFTYQASETLSSDYKAYHDVTMLTTLGELSQGSHFDVMFVDTVDGWLEGWNNGSPEKLNSSGLSFDDTSVVMLNVVPRVKFTQPPEAPKA